MNILLSAMLIDPAGQATVGNGISDRTFNLFLLILIAAIVISLFRGRGSSATSGGGAGRRSHKDRRAH